MEVKEEKFDYTKIVSNIDFDGLYGLGGSFLVSPLQKSKTFSKEMFSEDQKMFADAAYDYATTRMKPLKDKLSTLNKDLTLEIFKELGEMGFLGVDMPEKYGGSNLDKTTAAIVVDYLAFSECGSIMVTLGAHSGIGALPIVWYGNEQQKEKYLPKIASGEWLACFALTEPNAGSDAMNGQTTAYLNEEKTHYILNGKKIWITNGSWAQSCIAFAKVNGKMTAFIVDKECDGWVIGAEEKKMGIKVSVHYGSTECMRVAFDSGIHGEYCVDLINHHVEISKKNSEIIVTNLNNFCFPFIRYAIGDSGTLVNSEEMKFPILKDIDGRSGIFILNTLGNKFNTAGFSVFFMHKKYNHNDSNKFVKRFQIIQNEDLSLDVNLEMEPNFGSEKDYVERTVRDLRNFLRDEKMEITVNFGPILLGSNGKFQNFISKVDNKEENKFE